MKIKYIKNYLTDGTQVKITKELFNQINQWDIEGISISAPFLDELKFQDNEWINNTRRYYRNSLAIESLSTQVLREDKSLRTRNFQNISNNKILFEKILSKLTQCTEIQKRRFLLHYYYGMSYMKIAKIEGRSKLTIRESVNKVVDLLRNDEQF